MKGISDKSQVEIFKTAFESSYDGIHILDKEGNTLYINKACTRIEGISIQDAMSKNIRELVQDGVYSESVTLKVLKERAPATVLQTTQNGKRILATGTPIYKNGEIDKVVVNARDVTDLNQLNREISQKDKLAKKYHQELELLRREQFKTGELIAKSPAMQKIIRLSSIVSKVDSTVLISGESGVGKGVLANFIHSEGSRKTGPFIKIDCGAVPESLFESELFGYEKGAFTGAGKEGKIGLLELAEGGTVFLDEIGEVPISMQSKLLRAIHDREFIRVGGKEFITLDVRIIAATNVDLKKVVEKKEFRKDLYYRLNVVPIHIPPLRERPEDILPLILEFLKDINEKYGWRKRFTKGALDAMITHTWPGNVRELENNIERMLVSSLRDTVEVTELAKETLSTEDTDFDLKHYRRMIARYDYKLLKEAIRRTGSVQKAADAMGLNATTVRRKLKKYEELEK